MFAIGLWELILIAFILLLVGFALRALLRR